MPMSPVRRDTSGAEVTLAEVLGARQSAFGESDLWSVLYAACQSLEDYLTREKSTWSNGPTLLVTLDCTMLSQRGFISFASGKMDPSSPGSFAPSELLSNSRGRGRSAVEKIYIYSLGMTIYSSAELTGGEDMNLSDELETTLFNMCEDAPEKRPSLVDVMETCRKHTDGDRRRIVAMVSTVLSSLSASIHDMRLPQDVSQLEVDRVLGSQSGNLARVMPYSSANGRLPDGFISPESTGPYPGPMPVASTAPDQRRRESGYGSASLTNSAASGSLQQPALPRPITQITQWQLQQHGHHLQSAGSTSSDDEASLGVRPVRKVRMDSIEVARMHSTKGKKRLKYGVTSSPRSRAQTHDIAESRPTPVSSHEHQARQPSIVPLSPSTSFPVSPQRTNFPDSSVPQSSPDEEANANDDGELQQAYSEPQEIADLSKMIAREALKRSESRDPQKFADSLRRLESKGNGITSHRVLDNILDFDQNTDRHVNPVLEHALLNSVMGEDAVNSREVTGVFETTNGQIARVIPEPSEEIPTAQVTQQAMSHIGMDDKVAGPLYAEETSGQSVLRHKESLDKEQAYSLRQAKEEAKDTFRRHKQDALNSTSDDANLGGGRLPMVQERHLSSTGTDSTDGTVLSGSVDVTSGQSSVDRASLTLSPTKLERVLSDEVFEDDQRGFEPTSPEEFFERERLSSIAKLKGFFGPDFSKFDGEERRQPLRPKPYHVGMRKHNRVMIFNATLPSDRRVVEVVLLNDQKLQVVVEVESTAQEVFDQVVSHQAIKEDTYFGLLCRRDDEEIFLQLSSKLRKCAPKYWLEGTQPVVFTLYFRVKYFVSQLSVLVHSQTLHLYYLDLKDSLRSGRLCCPEETALDLASLALQDQFGDLRSDMGRQKYFLPEDFLSSMVMGRSSHEERHNNLTTRHSSHAGLSHKEAQLKFVQLAAQLQEYGFLFYRARATKHEEIPSMCIGINIGGISLTKSLRDNERQKVNRFKWQGIDNLLFKKQRFTIVPKPKNNQPRPKNVILWMDHYKMSNYIVQLCKDFHTFSVYLRQRNGDVPGARLSKLNAEKRPDSRIAPRFQTLSPSSSLPSSASRPNSMKVASPSIDDQVPICNPVRRVSRSESLAETSLEDISRIPLGEMDRYFVTLVKSEQTGLGLVVVGGVDTKHPGVFVKKLTPNSAASNCSLIERGDRLLSVNGETLDDLSHAEAIQLLRGSPPSCKLELARVKSSLYSSLYFASDSRLKETIAEELQVDESLQPASKDSEMSRENSRRKLSRVDSLGEARIEDISRVPLQDMERYTVTLVKKSGSGLGLVVVGGDDTKHRGVYVKKLLPDTAASESSIIQRGDRVLAVNGESLNNVTHEHAINALKGSPPSCTLQMARVKSARSRYEAARDTIPEEQGSPESRRISKVLVHSTPEPGREPQHSTPPELLDTSMIESTPVSGAHVVQVNLDASSPGPLEGNKSVTSLLSGMSGGNADLVCFSVKLTKEGGGLGIAITGGNDTPTPGGGVYISSINPIGPTAEDGRLQLGDRIISVNKHSTRDIKHHEAFELLRDSPDVVNIMVERAVLASPRRSSMALPAPGEIYETTITKIEGGLGFTMLKDNHIPGAPMTVKAVLPGKAAALTGLISPGDFLLKVDGQSLNGLSQSEAVKILRATSGQVHLLLQRPDNDSVIIEAPAKQPAAVKLAPAPKTVEAELPVVTSTHDDVRRSRQEVTTTFNVIIDKESKGLGLAIVKVPEHPSGMAPIVVKTIVAGAAAQKTGLIQEGDILLEANGTSLEGISQGQATEILKSMPQRVVLKLQRTSFVTTDALPPVDLVPLPQSEVDGRVEGGRPSSIRVSPLVERRSREFQDAPPIPPTDRPLYSDFSSDSESDLPDNSLNESYLARSRWPPGKVITVTVIKENSLGLMVQQEPGKCCSIRRILEGPILKNGQLKPKDYVVEVNGALLIDKSKADVMNVLKKTRNPVSITAVRPLETSSMVESVSQDSMQLTPPVSSIKGPSPLADEQNIHRAREVTPPIERVRRLSPIPSTPVGVDQRSSPTMGKKISSPLLKPSLLDASSSSMSLSSDVLLHYVPIAGKDANAEDETEVFTVELMKPTSGTLGLRLSGGLDKEDVPEGVYVRAVVEGTVAYDCGKIRVNDRVLEVNSRNLTGFKHARIVHLLRKSEGLIHFKLARLHKLPGDTTEPVPEDIVLPAVTVRTGGHDYGENQRASLTSKAVVVDSDQPMKMDDESSDDEPGPETTAAKSEGELSDFDENPIIGEDDVPPMPDTPEMGANIRTVLRRLSTGDDEFNLSFKSSKPVSPLANSALLQPTSLKLTFSPSSAQEQESPDNHDAPPTIPSSPQPPPLPSDPPPSDSNDDQGPSLPLSPPPDESTTGGISPSLVPVLTSPLRSLAQHGHPHDNHRHHHHQHDYDHEQEVIVDNTPLSPEERLEALHSGRPTVRRVNKYCKSCNTPPGSPPLSRNTSETGISPLQQSPSLKRRANESPRMARRSPSSPSVVRRSNSSNKSGFSLISPQKEEGWSSSPLVRQKTIPTVQLPVKPEQAIDSPRGTMPPEPVLRSIAHELHNPAVSPASTRKAHERLAQNTFSTAVARAQKLHPDPISPPSPGLKRRGTIPIVPPLNLSPITRRASSPRGSPLLHRQSMPNQMFGGNSPLLDRPSSWSSAISTLPSGLLSVKEDGLYSGKALENLCKTTMQQVNSGVPGQQFESLRHQPSPFSSDIGKNIRNKQRNRYRNIIAYDDTRVHLLDEVNDYVNANHVVVDVGLGKRNNYICTQGPLLATLNHFWCMVWQQNVQLIVMTTNLMANGTLKCHQYWPKAMGDIMQVEWSGSRFIIQLVEEKRSSDGCWMERKLMVSDVDTLESRTISQLHYITWPDHGVPKDTASLVEYVLRCRELHTSGKMLVHCSAGVGRTGAFCLLDSVITCVLNDQEADLFAMLKQLRQCRPLMVQTKDQLVFCYRAFIDILLSLVPDKQ